MAYVAEGSSRGLTGARRCGAGVVPVKPGMPLPLETLRCAVSLRQEHKGSTQTHV